MMITLGHTPFVGIKICEPVVFHAASVAVYIDAVEASSLCLPDVSVIDLPLFVEVGFCCL
jgi:hypothetical protein